MPGSKSTTFKSKKRYLIRKYNKAVKNKSSRSIPGSKRNIIGSYFSKIPAKVYSQTWNVCLSAKTKLTDTYSNDWTNKGIDPSNPNLIPTTWGIDFRLKDAINANEHYGLMFNRYKINGTGQLS